MLPSVLTKVTEAHTNHDHISVSASGRDQNKNKTKQTLQRSSQLREGSQTPFHVTSLVIFYGVTTKSSKLHMKCNLQKRRLEKWIEKRNCGREQMMDITEQAKVSVPSTPYGFYLSKVEPCGKLFAML